MNRRKFLKRAAVGAAAASFACGGLSFAALQAPSPDLPARTLGDAEPMNRKILVTYASKTGSTAEIAQAVAETLSQQGGAVDFLPLKQVRSLDGYDAVVLGSAVRVGSWLPEAVKFVEQHSDALKRLPLALFTVHGNNRGGDEASRAAREAYLAPVRARVQAKSEVFFGGQIEPARMSFLERMMTKAVKAEVGDFRDWDAIRAWSAALPGLLAQPAA
jgi:menaquinone-dependent protoporphyrinogen oxidase